MAVCPWCATEKKDPGAPCPNCGKGGAAARAASAPPASAVVSASRPPVTFDVPDLVMPAPRVSRPALSVNHASASFDDDIVSGSADLQLDLGGVDLAPTAPISTPTRAAGGGLDPFGDDDDLSGPSGLNIDLAVVPAPRQSGSLPAAPLSGPASHLSLPVPQGAAAIETVSGAADPFEARALADFGAVPEGFWLTPMYAFRVTKRRSELRQALAERRAAAAREATCAEDALVAFADRVRPLAQKTGWRGFANVVAEEEVLRGRDSGLAAEMDGHKAQLAQVDARLAQAEDVFEQAKAEERTIEAHLDAAEETRGRAEAKVKRIDIELRNAHSGTGGDAGNTQALFGARMAERDARAEEVAAQQPVIEEIQARLAGARRNVSTAAAKVSAARSDRSAADDRFKRQTGTRSEGVGDSRRRVRAALLDAGRMAFTDQSAFGDEFATARDEVRQAEKRALDAMRAVALHEAALTMHDQKKVQIGFVIAGVAVGLVLVLLLFPFIYRAIVV